MADKSNSAVLMDDPEDSLPDIVTAGELANMLGLSTRRLGQLVELGLPKEGRGRYPLKGAMRWYFSYLRRHHDVHDEIKPTRAEITRQLAAIKLKTARNQVYDRQEVLHVTRDSYLLLVKYIEICISRINERLNCDDNTVEVIRGMFDEILHNFVCGLGPYTDRTHTPLAQQAAVT